jgi:hypothetical protein
LISTSTAVTHRKLHHFFRLHFAPDLLTPRNVHFSAEERASNVLARVE